MERIQVIIRYSNGKIIKGHTMDFFPNKDRFHVTPGFNILRPNTDVIKFPL